MWAPSINDISPISKKFYDGFVAKYKAEPATYFAPAVLLRGLHRGRRHQARRIDRHRRPDQGPRGHQVRVAARARPSPSRPANIIKHQGIKNQKILQWQKGRQEVIWPFESATAKPVYPFPKWK